MILLLCTASVQPAFAVSLSEILLPWRSDQKVTPSAETMSEIFSYGVQNELNIIELMAELNVALKSRHLRMIINKPVIQEARQQYDFGGAHANILLPVDYLDWFEIGYAIGDAPELQVFLSEAPPDFKDRGFTIILQPHYGFEYQQERMFQNAFGLSARYLIFSADLARVEIQSDSIVAFYPENFFIPKRWRLQPIRER